MAMPKGPRVDRMQCRYCRQRPPLIEIKYVKGKPTGECMACNRLRQVKHRAQANTRLGLYKSLPEFIQANVRTLGTLQNGTYSLSKFTNREQVGYIIVKNDRIFVNLFNRADLFTYDIYGVASYLGNAGAFIDTATDALGQSLIAPDALAGLKPSDAAERLIWLDKALLAKAAKLLQAEARAIEAALAVQKTPIDSGDASD